MRFYCLLRVVDEKKRRGERGVREGGERR